jgi:hypothetical protein
LRGRHAEKCHGAGGFLAGRTIWLDAVRRYFPDRRAVADSLPKDGVAVLERLSDLTKAKPWTAHFPGFAGTSRKPISRGPIDGWGPIAAHGVHFAASTPTEMATKTSE